MTIRFDPDPIDRQIIEILHGDGRTSNRALGRQLGLSEAAIRKRLRRLTETGTITYGLLIDVSATNMRVFGWAYVEVHPSELSATYRALAGMDRCSGCAMKTGSFNLLAHIYAKDQNALTATIDEIYGMPGVRRVQFRQVNSYPIHRHQYVIDTGEDEYRSWHGGVVKADAG